MLDWPTAATLLGLIAAIIVAIIKAVPQRTVVQNSDGHKCASQQSVDELTVDFEKHSEYMHLRFHDVINGVSPLPGLGVSLADIAKGQNRIENKLSILMDRQHRGNRESHDETD